MYKCFDMKKTLFLLSIMCCVHSSTQKVAYAKLHGDTYVMDMIKGWEPSTGEKLHKKPARRPIKGSETTQITRIRPKDSIKDMGASITIMEFKGCKSYRLIQKQDIGLLKYVFYKLRYLVCTEYYKSEAVSCIGI